MEGGAQHESLLPPATASPWRGGIQMKSKKHVRDPDRPSMAPRTIISFSISCLIWLFQNLFLVCCKGKHRSIEYESCSDTVSGKEEDGEQGSRDMMLDLRYAGQSLDYLRAAANFSGGAVHLILLDELTEEEKKVWVEALSDAADHDKTPRSLLISRCSFHTPAILSALKKSKGLTHLFLLDCPMNHDCIMVLRNFISLNSLHLIPSPASAEFVGGTGRPSSLTFTPGSLSPETADILLLH